MAWVPTDEHPLPTGGTITALTGDVTASGSGSVAATIANDAVTNAKAANMAQSTIKGRAAGAGTGDPTDLTATQATAILDAVVGDSGSGGTKGLVPAPGSGDTAAGKFLKADGTFAVPATGGNAFGTVAVSGQSDVVADQANDTLTLVAGTNMTLTTSAAGDSVTFTAAGGGLGAKLFDSTLGSPANVIDTGAAGIAGGYDVLEILLLLRTDEAVAASVAAMTFNADTGNNYDRQRLTGINGTASAGTSTGIAHIDLLVAGASCTSGVVTSIHLTLPGYTQTTFFKSFVAMISTPDNTATQRRAETWAGQWRSTAAITRGTWTAPSTKNFLAGSRVLIYGR